MSIKVAAQVIPMVRDPQPHRLRRIDPLMENEDLLDKGAGTLERLHWPLWRVHTGLVVRVFNSIARRLWAKLNGRAHGEPE